jgi:outer membrane receptor protein involved in Fe transport
MTKSKRRWALGASAAIIGALTLPVAAVAQEASYQFNIPAQDLGAALRAFGQQSGQQIIFDGQQVSGKQSVALTGGYSAEEGLRRLLGGAALTFQRSHAGVLVVQDPNSPTRLGDATGASPSDQVDDVAEILVTGQRSLNADIRRSEDDIQPYVVIDRAQIERSGATNVENLIKNALPMAQVGDLNRGGVQGSSSSITLRGLGDNETLILIDGRRAPGYSVFGSEMQPDINRIPLAAIERIEVLPATASGIFGGGATGGAINIILRRDYTGAEASVTYRNTYQGDFQERRAELTGGMSLENGRTSVQFAGSYSDAGSLLVNERDFRERAFNRVLANNPSELIPGFGPPVGATTNIFSVSGADLTLKPAFGGGALNSPITFVPYGYAGPGSDNGAGLVSNAGHYNLDPANTTQINGGGLQSLISSPTSSSLNLTIRRHFTSWLELFTDLTYSTNRSEYQESNSFSFTLLGSDPANPFNEDVNVATPTFGANHTDVFELSTSNAVVGAIFSLPGDWRGEADFAYGRTELTNSTFTGIDYVPSSAAVSDGTLQLFRDTNSFPVDFSPYVLGDSVTSPVISTTYDYSLRAGGSLPFVLPGGAVSLSTLLEHRESDIGTYQNTFPIGAGQTFALFAPKRSLVANSVYAELRLPLFTEQNHVPGVNLLEFQLAGRYDDYELTGGNFYSIFNGIPFDVDTFANTHLSSFDPTIGVRYQPIADITLRASYGTGFLPPTLGSLVRSAPSFPIDYGLTDPLRGDEAVGPITHVAGGNPDIRPEQSESWSAGLILQPHFVPGLRFSVDWTRIEKVDAVDYLFTGTTQEGLDEIIAFAPERVTRGPVAPGDPFGVGPITSVDDSLINAASGLFEGIDFSFSYEWQTESLGEFTFSVVASHALHAQRRLTPVAPDLEAVGWTQLPWQGNATLAWESGPWTVSWTARYYDSYFEFQDHHFNPNQGSAKVDSQIFNDLYVGYDFGASDNLLRNSRVEIGAQNLFDTEAALDVRSVNQNQPYYNRYADARGGNYYIRIRRPF